VVRVEIFTEKYRLISMRKKPPNKKMVEAGRAMPNNRLMKRSKPCQIARTKITTPVSIHSHEYSSLSFLLLTNSKMRITNPTLNKIAKIFCRRGIFDSSLET